MAKLGLNCPIYATFPVQTMGKHSVVDALMNRKLHGPCDLFTRKEVEVAFNRITLLRYSQPYQLTGNFSHMPQFIVPSPIEYAMLQLIL
jgi:cleavage and polyadenylation specificity factor subunit 2